MKSAKYLVGIINRFCVGFLLVSIAVFLLFSPISQGSHGVEPYLEQIQRDLSTALGKGAGQADSEYANIVFNIGQMNTALQNIYNSVISALERGEQVSFPSISISNPIESEFVDMAKLREEIRTELLNLLFQYSEIGLRQYRQDMTFISNVGRETVNYASDLVPDGMPPGVSLLQLPGSIRDKMEGAEELKDNVRAIQETRAEAQRLHEEFNRVRREAFTDVDYHYKKLAGVGEHFDRVLKAHSWIEEGFADELERIRKAREEEEKRRQEQEAAAERMKAEADNLKSYTVTRYYIPTPETDEAKAALGARLRSVSNELNQLIQRTQSAYNSITRAIYSPVSTTTTAGGFSWHTYSDMRVVMRGLDPNSIPPRDIAGDVTKVELRQLTLLQQNWYLEVLPERRRESLEGLPPLASNLSALIDSYRSEGEAILSRGVSIAAALGSGFYRGRYELLMSSMAYQLALMNRRIEELPEYINNSISWGNELAGELQRRASIASSFISQYKSEYNSITYAWVEFERAVDEATRSLLQLLGLNMAVSDVWSWDGRGNISRAMSQKFAPFYFMPTTTESRVKEMFKEGDIGSIRNYLDGLINDYSSAAESILPVTITGHNITLARFHVDSFVSANWQLYDMAMNLAMDSYGNAVEDLREFHRSPSTGRAGTPNQMISFFESQRERLERNVAAYKEFIAILPTLARLDDSLARVYNVQGYDEGNKNFGETMIELEEMGFILDRWIDRRERHIYVPESESFEIMNVYHIHLPKTDEARRRALERLRMEQFIEELHGYRDDMQDLLQQGRTLGGYMEHYQWEKYRDRTRNARNAAQHALDSDEYSSNVKNVAQEILDLISRADEIRMNGPIEIVEGFYDRFARAYSSQNIRGVMELISRDWRSFDGERRRDLEDRLMTLFRSWDQLIVDIDIQSVSITEWGGKQALEVTYYISIEGMSFDHDFAYTEQGNVTDTLSITGASSFLIEHTRR